MLYYGQCTFCCRALHLITWRIPCKNRYVRATLRITCYIYHTFVCYLHIVYTNTLIRTSTYTGSVGLVTPHILKHYYTCLYDSRNIIGKCIIYITYFFCCIRSIRNMRSKALYRKGKLYAFCKYGSILCISNAYTNTGIVPHQGMSVAL